MKTRTYQRLLVNNWNNINWNKAESDLADLQYEILKAHRKEDCSKVIPRKRGGFDKLKNLCLLHKTCHKQITVCKVKYLRAIWKKKGIID